MQRDGNVGGTREVLLEAREGGVGVDEQGVEAAAQRGENARFVGAPFDPLVPRLRGDVAQRADDPRPRVDGTGRIDCSRDLTFEFPLAERVMVDQQRIGPDPLHGARQRARTLREHGANIDRTVEGDERASDSGNPRVREEVDSSRRYYYDKERCIFCDMIRQDLESGVRVIGETELFVTLAPYAPRFPFETWILPKQHASSFENNQTPIYAGLAKVLKDNLARLDVVLDRPAYNLMIHTSPIGEEINEHYHWHIEIMPKLTKVAGFEWGTGFYICPTPPEEAARFLRDARVVATPSR